MNTLRFKRLVLLSAAFTVFGTARAFAQSYDVAWTFGNVDFLAYRLDAFDPIDANLAPLGSENPTLPLALGQRIQVKVTSYTAHPFEVIAKASSASQDKVLLSMAVQGSFESDPAVAWEDNKQGTVRFTLTTALYQAMVEGGRTPGYRCRLHAFSMRGDFTVAGLPITERIAPSPVRVGLETVASGLAAPVVLVPDPVHAQRLYVVDQAGLIRVIDEGQLWDEPFLDVTDRLVQPLGILGTFDVNDFDERGFLGLAFHPGFADPESPGYRRLYTYSSQPVAGPADFTIDLAPDQVNHQSVITEWQVAADGNRVDIESARVLLRIDQPQFNHNAGHLAFGPDGYLYVALGDGGGANDTSPGHGPDGNGQNLQTVHGSILRIDPLAPDDTPYSQDLASANGAYRIPLDNPFVDADGIDEIYAYGLRNPYRFSFDARDGTLIVADVGQDHVEEIDIVHKGGNYGWHVKEGTFLFDPAGVNVGLPLDDPTLIDPVAQYDHDDGLSIIGGHTYYGPGVPDLWGLYVCGDFSRGFRAPDGRLLVADLFTGEIRELLIGAARRPLGLYVKGFGQDQAGEIYLLGSTALGPYGDTGVVLKIVPAKTEFAAELSAAAGTDSTATGQATFRVAPDGRTVSYRLAVEGLGNVTMAHIHIAAEPGGDGPPAVWLYPSAPPASLIPGLFSGTLAEGEFTAADFVGPLAGLALEDLLAAIAEDRAYVNVHTEQFPAGEIRGPVGAAVPEPPITAELTAVADTNSTATGQATFRVAPDNQTVSYRLAVRGIENVTMAHIHIAAEPDGDGPPAVWLYPSAPPASLIPGLFNGTLAEGEFTTANFVGPLAGMTVEDLLAAIIENRAYVNVHTEQFPAGEIRGPLQ